MPEDYLSFDEALRDLQLQEAELRAMVSQGKLRAFRDENTLKFRRADVENLRKQRETEPTLVMGTKPGKPTTRHIPRQPEPQPLSEEPIDLLADESIDYDDTAETIVGTAPAATGDVDLTLAPERPARDTKVPTIELTPADASLEAASDTAVPTIEVGTKPPSPGSDTEVPTMVLGLDEYDDTQVATEDVATEEVFLQEGELEGGAAEETGADIAEDGGAEIEEPAPEPGERRDGKPVVGSITGSSSFGTGQPLAVREEPSPLFTAMCAIASFMLLVPATTFMYCLLAKATPRWGIIESVMRFFCDSVFKIPYRGPM